MLSALKGNTGLVPRFPKQAQTANFALLDTGLCILVASLFPQDRLSLFLVEFSLELARPPRETQVSLVQDTIDVLLIRDDWRADRNRHTNFEEGIL